MATQRGRRKVTDSEILECIKSHPDPAVKSSEIAEEVGLTSTRVTQILNQLEEEGFVERKQFGSGLGWWISRNPD